MLTAIKDAISGKKTYILGCVAVVSAVVAWAVGELTSLQCISAVFVAVQTMFVRAGIKKGELH